MRLPITIILVTLLALGAIEGIAWWWMNPAGQGEPVLAYRPPVGLDRRAGPLVANGVESETNALAAAAQEPKIGDSGSEIVDEKAPPASASASSLHPPSTIHDLRSSISSSSSSPPPNLQSVRRSLGEGGSPISDLSSPTHTPLPEIYRQAAPMLRCTSGQVFHVQISDTASLHGAFFEWDGTDTGSVLEAFRHMPEACMGSIGMELVEKAPARTYVVRGQESEVRGQRSEVSRQQEAPASLSAASTSTIHDQRSTISSSNHSLLFDHTVFRDPGQGGNLLVPGPLVHAFRAVWVSGLSGADARQGLAGDQFDRLRSIRLKSALNRYRPAHARVIQGAVRGAANGDAAWKAFEEIMLQDLRMD